MSQSLDPLELAPVVTVQETSALAGDIVYTLIVTENATGGKQPYTYTYQWEYINAEGTAVNIVGATSSSYVVDSSLYPYTIGCAVVVTDSLAFTAEADSDFVQVSVPVVVETVTLTENNDGGERPIATDEITSVNVIGGIYSDDVTSNSGWVDIAGGFDGTYLSYGTAPCASTTLGAVITFTFPQSFTGRVRVWGRGSGAENPADSSAANSTMGIVTVNSESATWLGTNGTGDTQATNWISAGTWNTISIEFGGSQTNGNSLWVCRY